MRTPESLRSLADYGLIEEVLRPLMSGKEAQIYLVISQGQERVAKVYREATHRDFKHRSEYTQGRTVRNTRDQRAIAKRTRYGRGQDEAAWRAAEVDTIYRLADAGVRVPTPYHFIDGVLIMELVKDAEGQPAPRLGDVDLEPAVAARVYERLLREVIRMLCAGVVHGDLSDFNVLMDPNGPVLIDFPQSIDASLNPSARKLLLRDVENLHTFARRSMPGLRPRPYAQEMWELFQRGELTPETELRGHFKAADHKVDTREVLGLIEDADRDEARRRQAEGRPAGAPRRRMEVIITPPSAGRRGEGRRARVPARARPEPQRPADRAAQRVDPRVDRQAPKLGAAVQGQGAVEPPRASVDGSGGAPKKRSRRRRRRRADGGPVETPQGASPKRRDSQRRGAQGQPYQGATGTCDEEVKRGAQGTGHQGHRGSQPAQAVSSTQNAAVKEPGQSSSSSSEAAPARRRRRRRRRGPASTERG